MNDRAPAADPALDAVRELAYDFEAQRMSADEYNTALATIRVALAERLTRDEARLILGCNISVGLDEDLAATNLEGKLTALALNEGQVGP